MTRKVLILAILYLGLVGGLSGLLLLGVTQNPALLGSAKASWQLKIQRLTLQPKGRYLLPYPSAFVVHKGQITLITYPLSELTGVQSNLLPEGDTYGMMTNRHSSVFNSQNSPVQLILVQALESATANAPTPTVSTVFKGFSLEPLEQYGVQVLPSREELEGLATGYSQNLAKSNP